MTGKRFQKIKVYLSYEIVDNEFNEQLCVDDVVDLLNEQHEQLKNYKQFVSDLINEKLKEYPYLTLTEKWDKDCKYYHSCRENHEKNVAYASRHMLLQELKKELEEC